MRYLKLLVTFALCVLGLSLGASPPAAAQETPGYDPDDPAGVEYQLPLQRTRREAAGRKPEGRRRGASKPVPLFGAGIAASATRETTKPTEGGGSGGESSETTGGTGTSTGRGGGKGGAADKSTARDPGGRAGSARATAATKGATDSDGDDPVQLGLTGGILIVLLGAAVGIAVRMRTRGEQPEG